MSLRPRVSSLLRSLVVSPPPVWPEFDSFESALRQSDSYEDPYLVEVVRRKTELYRKNLASQDPKVVSSRQSAQNLFVLQWIEPTRPLSVLEIGGACGASYFEIDYLLPGRIQDWAVVETPTMVNAARSLADTTNLSLYSDVESAARAREYDVVIIQGTLQYAPNPLGLLATVFGLRSGFVYLTRTVVSSASAKQIYFTKQVTDVSAHGPGPLPEGCAERKSSQPMSIIDREYISSSIPGDYGLQFWFEESDPRPLYLGSNTLTVNDVGFLAAKLT